MRHLRIEVHSEPNDEDRGYRAEACGDPSFAKEFAEYGRTFHEAVGHLVQTLVDRGLLEEPVTVSIVPRESP